MKSRVSPQFLVDFLCACVCVLVRLVPFIPLRVFSLFFSSFSSSLLTVLQGNFCSRYQHRPGIVTDSRFAMTPGMSLLLRLLGNMCVL